MCSLWGTPDPGSLSGAQERGGCTTVGGKGLPRMCSREDKAGGSRRQIPDSHEKRASVPPLPDLHHLLFPISRGHIPAGTVTSHSSLHHSTGAGPGTTLPEPHNPPHPPVSSKSVANPRWTHQTTLSGYRPSWTSVPSPPLPEQCPEPLSSTGEELGDRCPLLHLTKLKNKTQNLQTSLDLHPEAQCQPDLLIPTPTTPEAELVPCGLPHAHLSPLISAH